MFVDTHTHLYLDDFLPSRETIVENAFAAGVEKLIFPNVDLTTIGPITICEIVSQTKFLWLWGFIRLK